MYLINLCKDNLLSISRPDTCCNNYQVLSVPLKMSVVELSNYVLEIYAKTTFNLQLL